MDTLTEIKCPFEKISKEGFLYTCGRVCVKVEAGSKGEVQCRSCKSKFYFEVDSQSNYKPKVVVQNANPK